MARLFPPEPPAGSPHSEMKVRRALARLSSEWRVFHSVAWQSVRYGRQGDGEADFVLLHRRHGLIVLEVKGGMISIRDGEWFSENRATREMNRIKNPFEQAKVSKYALLRHLDELGLGTIPICHGVALPDVTVGGDLSLDAPREICLDGGDLEDIEQSVVRVATHWGRPVSLAIEDISRVKRLLAPTIKAQTRLRNVIADTVTQLFDLTAEQIRALEGMRRHRRIVIFGPAGSGKTVLAVERARRLREENFSVLLVCFNRPLAEAVSTEFENDDSVSVSTFHQLCMKQAREARLRIPDEPSQDWWESGAAELLVQAAGINDFKIDAVVIDEGQDFPRQWFDALLLLQTDPDEGPFCIFADSEQSIYHRKWEVPADWPQYELTINCRSTLPIASKVAAVFEREPLSLGASGPKPQFIQCRSEAELLSLIPEIVTNLIDHEVLDPGQCVVLLPSRELVERIRKVALGDHVFVGLGKKGVVVETIHRFKGLEADVVILALNGLDLSSLDDRSLIYVGLSRARAFLMVLGTKADLDNLNWG